MVRKFIKQIALIITSIILLLFIIAWIAPYTPPRISVIPTYFVMLMPIWWALMLAAIIFWIWRKKWAITAFLICIMVLSFSQWRQTIVFNWPTKGDGKETLSILTYNIQLFKNQHNFEEIVDFIKNKDADILCLQEFGFYVNTGHSQQEILKALDAIYPYRHLWYKNQNKISHNGLATFSKYPIIKKKKIEYSSANNISIYSDILFGSDTIRVINNHLESNKLNYKDRDLANMLTNEKSDKNEIINTGRDVSLKLGNAAKNRSKQAEIIRKVIDKTDHYTIVAGDFNDVPASYTYQTIKGDLQDAYAKAGRWGYNWTYYENNMLFAIDHILVDKKFKVTESNIHKIKYSDHYPLSAIIEK